ncbi:hypothetical protein AQUCO_11200004v1 [Aquilegia coerulea]|uniref:F-box associated beta-propeller type 3 domain-containing protein n=1 Tax=Aquilegia coerulea TaxID=218851 RepID=A0A2G5C2J0_AQUCA|nr:hypothetical protein AQUCO_11200004v1 [Aquilegia coerulea]
MNVYSVKSASFLTISMIPCIISKTKGFGIFLNGSIHWVAQFKNENVQTIIAFDIEERVFRHVLKPIDVDQENDITIGDLGGQLCLLCKGFGSGIEIWVMKNYGWPYEFNKKLQKELRPMCFDKNGEVLLKSGSDLVLYNPKKKTLRNLEIHGISETDCFVKESIVTHIASLVQLKSGTYLGTDIGDEGKDDDIGEDHIVKWHGEGQCIFIAIDGVLF